MRVRQKLYHPGRNTYSLDLTGVAREDRFRLQAMTRLYEHILGNGGYASGGQRESGSGEPQPALLVRIQLLTGRVPWRSDEDRQSGTGSAYD